MTGTDERASEQPGRAPWAPPATPVADVAASTSAAAGGEDQSPFVRSIRGGLERVGLERLGSDQVELPFESFGGAVRWWFAPLADRRTWRAIVATLAMTILAPLLFAVTLATVVVTASLSVVLIGLLLIVPAFTVVSACSSVGRRLAGWAVERPAPARPTATSGRGVLGPISARLSDETRWRRLGFVLIDVLVAPLFLTATLLPISATLGTLGRLDVNVSTDEIDVIGVGLDLSVGRVLVVIVLSGLVARLAQLVARGRHRYVVAFIGPDREEALVERVEELSVQRDQVLDAVANERRRIERNLHDGVQQQLVALGIDIGRAARKLDDDPDAAKDLLDDARDKVRSSIGELRLIGRGLHPSVLEDRGLDAALSSVVASAPIPVSVEVEPVLGADGREIVLPTEVRETAYYVANEAVTNVLKYADARVASIRVGPEPG
ncbi:MAG: histidine kinase, partial [Actinomycetota bacterium]